MTVAVVPRKQEHALETREAGKEVTPVGKRSSSSVRPPGYTERVTVEVLVVILYGVRVSNQDSKRVLSCIHTPVAGISQQPGQLRLWSG